MQSEEKDMLDRMLRVDHAGEFGANRIYAGQMAVLGASSALLGKEGAMACTVAVEESISEHYNSQIRALMEKDPDRYTQLLQPIDWTSLALLLLITFSMEGVGQPNPRPHS
ncbi:5-demethoxyubiquinone hydroxylase, mitochondrial [Liparis tanakae]|uniref:5-demethoxyubiquinone hydroxylase, mitochondrial n=1 Tax=Liparis tanakae TaxID=230148 RepID=A0A4Z2FYB2_9TELE|nr:5-demethoxyubiquinone hydroxylase, mitochondrial [Liparis tanakae]